MPAHRTDHGDDDRAAWRPPPRTHLSAAGLRVRGWTPGLVRHLLGEPDLLRPHPHLRSAPQTRLYRLERVRAAERSGEFRAVWAAAARRSTAARAAAARRRRVVLRRRVYASLLAAGKFGCGGGPGLR
ncbi:hypothetical protein K4B79_05830 [Streptomyces lincolnensis]|uniref:hypothetical protein n=1 Tax=Streptomyces lincolnensis TaxID=1915 RepID=UPI001E41B6D3|nr:hypothetical protein [Streptomyces lincolnensis]MCD7437741.1 hypothetical protein [Streptomyces lincolnensis]